MFGRIGPMELILILVIALIIFGPKKLPEIGKAVGDAVRAFKKSSEKLSDEIDKATTPEQPKVSSTNSAAASPEDAQKPQDSVKS
jgi:sec-independent protein translocase protein TatA